MVPHSTVVVPTTAISDALRGYLAASPSFQQNMTKKHSVHPSYTMNDKSEASVVSVYEIDPLEPENCSNPHDYFKQFLVLTRKLSFSLLPVAAITLFFTFIGAAIGTIIFFSVQAQENREVINQLHVSSDDVVNDFNTQMEMTLANLKSLKAFYYGSGSVGPGEFHAFLEISGMPKVLRSIHSFSWITALESDSAMQSFLTDIRSRSGYESYQIFNQNSDGTVTNVTSFTGPNILPVTYYKSGYSFNHSKTPSIPLGSNLAHLFRGSECYKSLNSSIENKVTTTCALDSSELTIFLPAFTQGTQYGALMVRLSLTNALLDVSPALSMDYLNIKLETQKGSTAEVGANMDGLDPRATMHKTGRIDDETVYFTFTLTPNSITHMIPLWMMKYIQIALCILIALMLCVAFLGVTKFIKASIDACIASRKKSKQLNNARTVAEAISNLRLQEDCVNELVAKSNPSELESILKKIVLNVREYVKFLPASLLSSVNADDEEEESDIETNSSEHSFGSRPSKDSKGTSKISSDDTKSKHLHRKRQNLSTGLRSKHITILYMDISDTLSMIPKCREASRYVDIHADFVDSMIHTVKGYGGECVSVNSDKILFSWNAVAHRINPETRACEAACKCLQNFNDNIRPQLRDQGVPDTRLKQSIVSGKSLVGTMGRKYKSFAYFSVIIKRAQYLCKLNKAFGTDILVDSQTIDKTDMKIESAMMDKVKFHTVQGEREQMCCVHVLSTKCGLSGGDEWLYEVKNSLDDTASNNKDILNKAWMQFLEGDEDSANSVLQKLVVDKLDDYQQVSLQRLEQLLGQQREDMLDQEEENYCRIVKYV